MLAYALSGPFGQIEPPPELPPPELQPTPVQPKLPQECLPFMREATVKYAGIVDEAVARSRTAEEEVQRLEGELQHAMEESRRVEEAGRRSRLILGSIAAISTGSLIFVLLRRG
jgi:hypothetical protein